MNSRNDKPIRIFHFACLTWLFFSLPMRGYPQVQLLPGEILPTLQNVGIDVSVQFSTGGIFTYSYVISNPSSNTGQIWLLDIDISRSSSVVSVGSDGLTSDRSFPKSGIATFDENAGFLVPVGFRSPPGWHSGFTINLTANWGASNPKGDGGFRIHPGEVLGGFALQSRGIPGIRKVMFQPKFEQTPVDDASATDVQRIRTIAEQIKFSIVTVGPTAPVSLASESLIDNLIFLKHQSVSLGWLRGPEFIKDLDEKLDQAKLALARSKPFKARKKLEQFVKKLEEQRKEQQEEAREREKEKKERGEKEEPEPFINGNAFFLLKPNAESIISKLPAKPEEKDEDKDD